MTIEHINKTDTLNEGREKLNAAIDGANAADVTSKAADTKATQALANSESTQTQLDTIVIDGDSSVEAAQARVDEKGDPHPTLKARIDDGFEKTSQQLAETDSYVDSIYLGTGLIPERFPLLQGEDDDTERLRRLIEFAKNNGISKVFLTKDLTVSETIEIDSPYLSFYTGGLLKERLNGIYVSDVGFTGTTLIHVKAPGVSFDNIRFRGNNNTDMTSSVLTAVLYNFDRPD